MCDVPCKVSDVFCFMFSCFVYTYLMFDMLMF